MVKKVICSNILHSFYSCSLPCFTGIVILTQNCLEISIRNVPVPFTSILTGNVPVYSSVDDSEAVSNFSLILVTTH